MPKEDTFPIPVKYIDVASSTYTNLDVMQEKRLDDCWNVDSNRSLSVSWKGFTKFCLRKNTQGVFCGPAIEKTRMDKREAKSRQRSKTVKRIPPDTAIHEQMAT